MTLNLVAPPAEPDQPSDPQLQHWDDVFLKRQLAHYRRSLDAAYVKVRALNRLVIRCELELERREQKS